MNQPGVTRALWAVWKKEMRIFFLSPVAYIFLGTFLFLSGVFFYLGLALTGEASLRPMMNNLALVLMFCLPMLTMRLFAEEVKVGTLELLMTAPISLTSLIGGKWLAALSLCGLLLLLTTPFPAILLWYGEPDTGVLFTSYLGLFLCCAAFASAGLFASTLTRDQMVAGVGGILLLLPFWLAGMATELVPASIKPVMSRLALNEHLISFGKGVLDTGDVSWFICFSGVFLFLTWRSLESRRWR